MVKKCLDKKADINFEDKKKWNAINYAACKNYIKILKLLISRGGCN